MYPLRLAFGAAGSGIRSCCVTARLMAEISRFRRRTTSVRLALLLVAARQPIRARACDAESQNLKPDPLVAPAHRRRVKIWGEARVVEGDAELTARLMPQGYKARAAQLILFKVVAWDANCPQHIPQRLEAADVAAALAERDRRIETLESEIRQLRLS